MAHILPFITSQVGSMLFWMVVFVLALLIEMANPRLLSIWFCGGAFISFVLSLFPQIPFWIEVLVFSFVSTVLLVLSLVFFRKRILAGKGIKTNIESLFGEEVRLLTDADKETRGEVMYKDVIWKVSPFNLDEVFNKDEIAIVHSIQGNRLLIIKKGKKEDVS